MLWIKIDNGGTFEGTLEQFQDCFFSNATKESIIDWCKGLNSIVEFVEILEIEGRQYEVLHTESCLGKTLLTIYNEQREQYETYSATQNPKIIPLGADEQSLEVSVALAIDELTPYEEEYDGPCTD